MHLEERSRGAAGMPRYHTWIVGPVLLLLACSGSQLFPAPTLPPTLTLSPLPSPTAPDTVTPIFFPTYTFTVSPTETPIPTLTYTPTLTPEPQWVMQGPDNIIVPILLYHHIGISYQGDTVYYVSPDAFDRQMSLLYQWGYQTISVELLTRAINMGAALPPKPVILTFDDGSETTYTTALPIMQKYKFTGTAYLVFNYIGIPAYLNKDEIRALYAAGWEIGSHGLSHTDLPSHPKRQGDEIVQSRRWLEQFLEMPVRSFSYPFGTYDDDSLYFVHHAGYSAAMGLGNESLQGKKNLFYLYRRPVTGTDNLIAFTKLLPWQGDLQNLPPLTIVP